MTTRLALTVALLSAASAAAAQPRDAAAVDPVVASFREYRAAVERGDAEAAEAAAVRGLEASERVNGPKTAVLALNLAAVRLDRGEPDTAYAPARRAYELATADATSGVDPLLASLTLGRAQLAVDREDGVTRLREAIAEAESRGAAQSDAYAAAVELARTSFTHGEYDTAREAWATSARLAGSSADDPNVARGLARTGEGAAIFMQAIKASVRRPGAAGALATVIEVPSAQDASAAFAEALDLLQPSAEAAGQGALTLAQRGYAEALAWDGALRAKMQSQGDDLPRADHRSATAAGRCSFRLVPEPAPNYPRDALLGSGFGAVVMRVRTDERGVIVDRQIAAAIPSGSFSDAVAAVSGKWHVEPGTAPGCRRDGTQYTPILFVADAAEEPADALIDEVIVRGQTPPALRLEIERAEDAVFARFNAITSNHEFDIHCELEKATGTRIPQRVCGPVFLHEAQARSGRDVVLTLQGFSGADTEQIYVGQAAYEYKLLDAEMRKLAGRDEEFFAALQHLVELRQAAQEAAKAGRSR
jgi:hypothetical protein